MLKGVGVSDGIGLGKAYIVSENAEETEKRPALSASEETARYKNAVREFCEKTENTAREIEKSVGKSQAEILSGHASMLRDPYIVSETEKLISDGKSAEEAVKSVLDTFEGIFTASDDELTRQRAADVRDVKTGVLAVLSGKKTQSLADLPENSVIVARDLTPSMTAQLKKENVAAIISETGGETSHCAILARAMGIPAVLGVRGICGKIKNGQKIAVDGGSGEIGLITDEKIAAEYESRKKKYLEDKKSLDCYIGRKTVTKDGRRTKIFCNIGSLADAKKIKDLGGEGVGLFRTEFLFMDRHSFPSEQEQLEAYKSVAEAASGKPVIIRTLDVGGDKNIPYMGLPTEENPFLGFRAIRYCLENTDVFKTQLRALLRASAYGDIRIMLPLVTRISEVCKAKSLVRETGADLKKKGIKFNEKIKLGVMIETPAAAAAADLLADEADFFSIGTNDLTQYVMAADRGNARVGDICTPFDPAVLRCIRRVIHCAREKGIPVGMCGEAASDRKMIPLLISFGLDEFSVSPSSVPRVRREISKWTKEAADEISQEVMSMRSAREIEEFLEEKSKTVTEK